MLKGITREQIIKERIKENVKYILDANNTVTAAIRLLDFLSFASSIRNAVDCVIELKKEITSRYICIKKSYNFEPIILEGNQSVILYLYAVSTYDFHTKDEAFFLLGSIATHMLQTHDVQLQTHNLQANQGSDEIRLSKKDVAQTFNMLENRFKIKNKILGKDKLSIGLLDNSLKNENGTYAARFLSDGTCEHFIFIPYEISNFGCPQQITLIHEVGHLLHTCLTRRYLELPVSFDTIKTLMFSGLEDATPLEKADVFADCFVVAATNEMYLDHRPLPFINPDYRDIIEGYFNELINNTYKSEM